MPIASLRFPVIARLYRASLEIGTPLREWSLGASLRMAPASSTGFIRLGLTGVNIRLGCPWNTSTASPTWSLSTILYTLFRPRSQQNRSRCIAENPAPLLQPTTRPAPFLISGASGHPRLPTPLPFRTRTRPKPRSRRRFLAAVTVAKTKLSPPL
eukprot:3855664-Prymnesium_polylepis.1